MRHEAGRQGRPRAILIAGPTASGKSALALRFAGRAEALIVNADSMQVYRDLSILTSRPSPQDLAREKHALYGMVDSAEAYSVSRWLRDVAAILAAAERQGRMPIVVGGTGLYFKALTQGLSAIPDVPDDVRANLRAWAADRPAPELHAELARRDPETAKRLRPTDPQRVLRALEVHAATGESLAAFQGRREAPLLPLGDTLALHLVLSRELLHERVSARFDAMLAEGALDEVERLVARRLDPKLPAMRAIGVPELAAYLDGTWSRDQASEGAKAATRKYIRRQETFARNQLAEFRAITPEDADDLLQSSAYVRPSTPRSCPSPGP